MARKTYIVGVGMTKYEKPRNRIGYEELGLQAATKALLDAGINYDDVEQAYVGYCYGDSTCGQRALYRLGMTQIPIVRRTESRRFIKQLFDRIQAVAAGSVECAMALGFEKMAPGSLSNNFNDRTNPLDKTLETMSTTVGMSNGPFAAQIFGNGGNEYCQKYGAKWEDIAAIASKNHEHSTRNPYSQFQNAMSVEEVLKDKKVTAYLTRAMCCPTSYVSYRTSLGLFLKFILGGPRGLLNKLHTLECDGSDGGACALVASEEFVRAHKLENQAIEVAALTLTTDSPKLYEKSAIELTGADMTRRAARAAYRKAGITPQDGKIKVVECHDCFAANELLLYDSLGLAEPGKAHEMVRKGDNTYGGKFVVNPSGGLESKGHPLGATGLGNVFYLVTQLRGWSGPMQVDGAKPDSDRSGEKAYALLHNLGLGGACVVGLFKRPNFYEYDSQRPDGRARLGYNHGAECREPTRADVDKVKSKTAFSDFAAAAHL